MSGQELFKKDELQQEKRFFANKKANIGFAVSFGVIILAIAGAAVWVNFF